MSELDSIISEKRQECFPAVWLDRQMAIKLRDIDGGDSASVVVVLAVR